MTSAAPPGSVDCHVHLFDPERFPYAASRRYTPPPATLSDLLRMRETVGIRRFVLVQPSVYGSDNACLLDGLKRLGADARGIAVIGDSCSRAQLDELHGAGVRGVRVNIEVLGATHLADARQRLQKTIEILGDSPLLLQVNAAMSVLLACEALFASAGREVLIDHFGHAKAAAGIGQPGFSDLLALARHPNVWMKLSGTYQISAKEPAREDADPIAKALLAAFPTRTVWGSDWPHTGGAGRPADSDPLETEPFRNEDELRNLAQALAWVPARESRQRLFVGNPARLFGFAPCNEDR